MRISRGRGSSVIQHLIVFSIIIIAVSVHIKCETNKKLARPKKDIRDFNDADLERLYDQWEENEEPLPDDELPEHLRPPPKHTNFPLDQIGSLPSDEIMKIAKKGQSVIMFVNLDKYINRNDCEKLTSLWQQSLSNNHIQVDRFIIEGNRAIFLFNDGARAWEAKDFLLDQEGLLSIALEGKNYIGRRTRDKDLTGDSGEE